MTHCSLCKGSPVVARGYCRRCYNLLYVRKGEGWNDRRTKKFRNEADAPKPAVCAVQGCGRKPFFKGCCQRCYQRLRWRLGPKWREEVPKLVFTPGRSQCCWKTCWKEGTCTDYGAEFPVCPNHKMCIWEMQVLEEIHGYKDAMNLPDDIDWLFARDMAELREYSRSQGKDTKVYNKVIGETPLFPIFMHLFGCYLPILKSL